MTLAPNRISPFLVLALAALATGPAVAIDSALMRSDSADAGKASKLAASDASGQLLCAAGESVASKDGLGWYDTGRGLTLLPVKAGQACSLLATSAGLNVAFTGQPAVLLAGPVRYRLDVSPRLAELPLAEPALCESYYAGADRLALRLTDTNGVEQTLPGLSRVAYTPSAARFVPESTLAAYGPNIQCYAFPFASLIANPPAVPAIPPVDPNAVFASGFDDTAKISLEIFDGTGALRVRELEVLRDQAFDYRIRITNTGPLTATGIRLREFVPIPVTTPMLTPVVTAGAWTCSNGAGAPCSGVASGSGVLALQDLALAPGESRTYQLTRTVSSGAAPSRTLLGAAVFFDPGNTGAGDNSTLDNSAPLVLKLVPNQPPMVACAGLTSPVDLDENAAPIEFTCTLSDPEGDAISNFAVQSNSNNTVIPTAGMLSDLGGDTWRLRFAPALDQLGTANIVLRASDDRGAQRDVAVTVNVNDVNSAPSFDLLSSEIRFSPTGGLPRDASGGFIDSPDVSFGPNCSTGTTCTLTFPDFIKNRSVGLPPESAGQQLSASLSCGPQSVGASPFQVAPEITPATSQPVASSFVLALTYRKSNFDPAPNPAMEVLCTITVTDTGSPPMQFQRPLRFTINN